MTARSPQPIRSQRLYPVVRVKRGPGPGAVQSASSVATAGRTGQPRRGVPLAGSSAWKRRWPTVSGGRYGFERRRAPRRAGYPGRHDHGPGLRRRHLSDGPRGPVRGYRRRRSRNQRMATVPPGCGSPRNTKLRRAAISGHPARLARTISPGDRHLLARPCVSQAGLSSSGSPSRHQAASSGIPGGFQGPAKGQYVLIGRRLWRICSDGLTIPPIWPRIPD